MCVSARYLWTLLAHGGMYKEAAWSQVCWGKAVTRISHLSTTKIMRSRSAAKIIYLMLPKYSEDKKSYVGDTILNNSFLIPCVNSS